MTVAVVMCIEPITSLLDVDVSRLSGPDSSDSTVKTATVSTKAVVAWAGANRRTQAEQEPGHGDADDAGRHHGPDRQPGGRAAAR